MFATIYKTLMIVQKKMNGGKEANLHPFIAGIIGGYYVFGENNGINQQSCIGYGESTCEKTSG
ncbi:hypothetical protein RO3G_11018 [Rhizopus delemar RA 99-880]|uniref:Uncharacterized protein n=1 Tax=Rhizopus delemar (strain RA 99-880 / ATCC MYA-4621 / FGSC 9543 / NRRL 43880) TaxID=246409 RepID=I1CCX7_RHIO9|nr:hypothetical protein RO3G_11018 [Rhizopus delemar RA 99-880]|eukprot:EIE86307.1 hypothetical protein RO3G_11018 [Rhizopus delemar RA 99-880]